MSVRWNAGSTQVDDKTRQICNHGKMIRPLAHMQNKQKTMQVSQSLNRIREVHSVSTLFWLFRDCFLASYLI